MKTKSLLAIVLGATMLLQSTAALATSIDIQKLRIYYDKIGKPGIYDKINAYITDIEEPASDLPTSPDKWYGTFLLSYIDPETGEKHPIIRLPWQIHDFEHRGDNIWVLTNTGNDDVVFKKIGDKWTFSYEVERDGGSRPEPPTASAVEFVVDLEITPIGGDTVRMSGSTIGGVQYCSDLADVWSNRGFRPHVCGGIR